MGISQIRGATSYAGDLLAGLVSMAAAVTTVAILHPALAPVVLLTAFPPRMGQHPRRQSKPTSTSSG